LKESVLINDTGTKRVVHASVVDTLEVIEVEQGFLEDDWGGASWWRLVPPNEVRRELEIG
jgi:hypothetical protein